MAKTSLAYSQDSMKLEDVQVELSITLEQIYSLITVALDESFLSNKKRVRYSYLSVLHRLSEQAMSFNKTTVCEQG